MNWLAGIYFAGVTLYGLIIVIAGALDKKVSTRVVIAALMLAPAWPLVVGGIIYSYKRRNNK